MAIFVIASILTAGAWIGVCGFAPASRQQAKMAQAAALLHELANQSNNHSLVLERRQAAAGALVEAYALWPANVRALEAAAIQLQIAASSMKDPPMGLLMRAQEIAERAVREHGKPSSIALAIEINAQLGALTGDQEHWRRAIDLARRMTQLDPHGLGAWRRLGDVLWLAGYRAEAVKAYQRALECDEQFVLDELKRLSDAHREIIQSRVVEGARN